MPPKMKKKVLKTTDVPCEFLEAAFLVGHVPQMALQSDARISYALYIPAEAYKTLSNQPCSSKPTKLPLLVNIHGTRRNLSAMYNADMKSFADSAASCCAILQPLFPAGMDGANDLDSYKRLVSKTLRADLALVSILEETAIRWPYIETSRFFLMGFSGGGQFVQRFLYLYPERLAAVSIGAPGKVTLLDKEQDWPKGIKNVQEVFGREVDVESIKSVDVHMVVGSKDTDVHGGKEFKKWQASVKIKTGAGSDGEAALTSNIDDAKDGRGRLGTLKNIQRLWRDAGIEAQLDVVEGVGHSADGVRACVLEHLGPLMKQSRQ